MTYYEEFGLSPRATEAEIKRSYKRLTLLLHPDQHGDPEIRALAEVQMKRLNEIVGILADPEQRRIYDKQFSETISHVRHLSLKPSLVWLRNNQGWLLVSIAFLLFLGTALLIPNFDSARPIARAESQAPLPIPAKLAPQPPRQAARIQPGERGGPKLRVSRADPSPLRRPSSARSPSAAPFETPVARAEVGEGVRPPPLVSTQAALSVPSPPLDNPAAPVASKTTPELPPLAGKWIFTPDPMDQPDPTIFPAEYVELTILAADGRLRGMYKSRYKLSNRSLSPYANFTFDGPASGTSFVWRGEGDAQGQVTLRLQSRDTLQVNWYATSMGSELSLGSGRATVYRFR
jgi:curved DNA-binding protein CbpA